MILLVELLILTRERMPFQIIDDLFLLISCHNEKKDLNYPHIRGGVLS